MNDYFTILVILVIIDLIWLFLQKDYYSNFVYNFQGSKMNVRIVPAVLLYFILAYAIYTFAIKSKDVSNKTDIIKRSALLGLIIYGIYDLTNYATLTKWTLHMTIIDITWGSLICALTAAIYLKVKN